MTSLICSQRVQRWSRFILGGGANTAFTYLVYLTLNTFLYYQFSYMISYAIGVVFSYWFNARVVFGVPLSWKGLSFYPIVYALQYAVSVVCLGGLVEYFEISEMIAPLVIAVTMIPFTYLMSKFVLRG